MKGEIFFVFSDESGNYKPKPGRKFLRSHPYYIRSAYIIKAIEWITLRTKIAKIKRNYEVEKLGELKWSKIWQLYKKREISKKKFKNFLNFIEQALSTLSNLSFCKVIYTVTLNNAKNRIAERKIKTWHIQNVMQRVQMEIQKKRNNLAVIFIDPPSSEKERKLFQEIYKEIFLNDRFIKEYKNLKDTINFEPSHYSVGIQLADYLAGCFRGFLCDYKESKEFFLNIVSPLLRREEKKGTLLGFGIISIPDNGGLKEELENKFLNVGIEI